MTWRLVPRGANFQAELRPPSMRGCLRFWLRALLGGSLGEALNVLRAAEAAAAGSLWTEEFLPPETLLYACLGVRAPQEESAAEPFAKPAEALAWVKGLAASHLQIGGGQTLGHGLVRLRWSGKKPPRVAKAKKTKKA